MKDRKRMDERLRRSVQVLFNDYDYLKLLEVSSPIPLSQWCREVILEALCDLTTVNPSDS